MWTNRPDSRECISPVISGIVKVGYWIVSSKAIWVLSKVRVWWRTQKRPRLGQIPPLVHVRQAQVRAVLLGVVPPAGRVPPQARRQARHGVAERVGVPPRRKSTARRRDGNDRTDLVVVEVLIRCRHGRCIHRPVSHNVANDSRAKDIVLGGQAV